MKEPRIESSFEFKSSCTWRACETGKQTQGRTTPNHSAHLLLEAVLQDTAPSESRVYRVPGTSLFSLSATAFQA